MCNIINILQKPQFDNSIIKKEYHSYTSYLQSFKNNDEIRISIQNQDLYILPSESFLYIEGTASKEDGTVSNSIKLLNNCMAHLFDKIRYELNGIEIDRTRHLGITTEIKNFAPLNKRESLLNAGWSPFNNEELTIVSGYFKFCIPLKMLLGFAEDFNKIIVNSKHELILLRSKDDKQTITTTSANEQIKLSILNITWKMPHVQLADVYKLEVHLKSDSYPYDDLNLRFSRNQFALLYDMYSRFQQSYYLRDPYPLLKRNECLTHAPIVVLDVTHQNGSVKTEPIDIRIELKASMIGNPIPFTITTPQADSNSKTVAFNLTLPNDDVLRINISFVIMKVSEALETKDNDYLLRDQGDVTSLTTSTTISPPIEIPTSQQQQEQEKTTEQTALKYFSVDDAIEAFRKSFINSEMDIGGILEAEKYENVDVPIRCTYKSIYEQRELKINCFEYREFEKERILSNGEIEKVRTPDLSRRLQNIQIVYLKDYTQTYKMNVTVKCSYYSNYVYRKLNICCFEFNNIPSNFDGYDGGGGGGGNQRENSNIIERENQYEANPPIGRPDNDIYVRTIDINDYLQTFDMSIQ
uniref:Double jelly roll-like domain-containing protein n=1 Tax=Glossina morsitans morsitans TaxID=37546 RepID=A0A1B0GEK0_GLOMM